MEQVLADCKISPYTGTNTIKREEIIMFGPKGPFCQSFGMPLAKDENGGGTAADGTKSADYCSRCYQKGQFTEPDLTVDQMMDKVRGKMKEMHFPGFIANIFVKEIPKLKRWS